MKLVNCSKSFVCAVAATCAFVAPAHAGLIGGTVQVQWNFPAIGTPYLSAATATITDPGVEFTNFTDGNTAFGTIDFTDNRLTITHGENRANGFTPAAFNGLVFTDILNSLPDFTSVTLISSTYTAQAGYGAANFDASRVTFDANNIYVNFWGQSNVAGAQVILNIQTVPEPASLVLLGLGLAGLGISRRKKQKAA